MSSASYDSTFPDIYDGFSRYLTDVLLSPTNGNNWAMSCNEYGTPGAAYLTDCSVDCYEPVCQTNGDSSAQCSSDQTECECTTANHFYQCGASCCICYVFFFFFIFL